MTDLRAIGFEEVRARLTSNRLDVYDALVRRGPSTGSELARAMGWTVLSVRPRITELCDMYHADVTGRRRDGEHEFRACSPTEAERRHKQAQEKAQEKAQAATSTATNEQGAGQSGEVQAELFSV